MRFTIPVTSPVPPVVAAVPMFKVKLLILRHPCVAEAFALFRLRTPLTVMSASAVLEFVPVPLMVRLL